LRLQRVAAFCVTALALVGCQWWELERARHQLQGRVYRLKATQSMSIAPAGGSVSVTLGSQTVTIIVPSGALSAQGTVSVTLYAPSFRAHRAAVDRS